MWISRFIIKKYHTGETGYVGNVCTHLDTHIHSLNSTNHLWQSAFIHTGSNAILESECILKFSDTLPLY